MAAFINYWDPESLVSKLRTEARDLIEELADPGTEGHYSKAGCPIPHLYYKKGYTVGTEEDHDEMILNILAGTSRLGTTITEYQRPGCRGKSKNSLLISTAGHAAGPGYIDAICAMLNTLGHAQADMQPKRQMHITGQFESQHHST